MYLLIVETFHRYLDRILILFTCVIRISVTKYLASIRAKKLLVVILEKKYKISHLYKSSKMLTYKIYISFRIDNRFLKIH